MMAPWVASFWEKIQAEKKTWSFWVMVGFLIALLVLFTLKIHFFWNLYHDLKYVESFFPQPMGSATLVFTDGLSVPASGSGFLYDHYEAFAVKSQDAIVPGSFSPFLGEVPGSGKTIDEILKRVQGCLASMPAVNRFRGDILWDAPEIMCSQDTYSARYWVYLAFASIESRPGFEVGLLLLGPALIGLHCEAFKPGTPFLFGKMIRTICQDKTGWALIRCAPSLKLSRDEARELIYQLQRILDNTTPISDIFKQEALIWKNLAKNPSPDLRGLPDIPFWAPGNAFYKLIQAPLVQQELQENYFAPLIKCSESSWSEIKREAATIQARKEIVKKRATSINSYWILYFFYPERFLTDRFFMTHSIPASIISQGQESRQYLLGAQWAIGVSAFSLDQRASPKNQTELETWLGMKLPDDIFTGKPPIFNPGPPLDIRSVGSDQVPYTDDDIRFIASSPALVE